MRCHFCVLVYLFLLSHSGSVANMNLAEGSCGIEWPGWRIELEDEYKQSTKYPLVNMFDDNSATAWVFHKSWHAIPPYAECDDPDGRFNHGIGAELRISSDDVFVADGIGIINGYAKNRTIYRRNNRITRLHLDCEGWKDNNWRGSYSLKESMEVQRINFPRMKIFYISLEVEDVAVGPDDDLCISELVLFNHGKPIPWRVPAAIFYSNSGANYGCSSMCTGLSKTNGRPVYHHGKPVGVNGNARLPGTGFTLIGDEHRLYVYDFIRNQFIAEHTFPGRIKELGWIDHQHAMVRITGKRSRLHWYRFTLPSLHWEAIPHPRTHPAFLPGAEDPFYNEGGC